MKDYNEKAIRTLQLAGMTESTQKCYARSVIQLVKHYGKYPDQISEQELEDYFLHKQNEDEWKSSTLRISYSGIKFFFTNVLKREWHLFQYLHAKREYKLPCILSQEEVFQILDCVTTFHNYTYYSTVYACGLRLSEGLNLQISDIDSQRMMIHVHRGKGAKDRYVPLPNDTLILLRRYRTTHRNPKLIFPALGRNGQQGPTTRLPMNRSSVQGAFIKARIASGIKRRRVSIHTLRHCYATHLLE